MSQLLIQCGSQRCSLEQLLTIPEPQQTKTYTPLNHYDFAVNVLTIASDLLKGYRFDGDSYALSPDGQRMFGVLTYRNESSQNEDLKVAIGLRNSYDRSMSAGLVIGSSVVVCDNLIFAGDIKMMCKQQGDVIFITALSLACGTFEVYVIIGQSYQTVTLFINSPIPVPEPRRAGVAEYLMRVNYHSREGSLKLDFSNGMLYYCYVLRFDPESDMSHIAYQLDVSLAIGIDELEQHFPGILVVIYQDQEPAQAIAETAFGSNPELN